MTEKSKKSAAARVREDDARARDEFLTAPAVAKRLITDIMFPMVESLGGCDVWLEPSAGAGAFLDALPLEAPSFGLDIAPQSTKVQKADFLTFDPSEHDETRGKRIALFGNPPFGKNSSLAIKFVNKGAHCSAFVGMILPRTFRKDSVIRRLDPRLHLIHDSDVESGAFLFKGAVKDVPCAFMVWRVGESVERPKASKLICHDFDFVQREDAELSFQRVGVNAGTVRTDFADRASASHYFLKPKNSVEASDIESILATIDWKSDKDASAGNPSIPKRELIRKYENAKAERRES